MSDMPAGMGALLSVCMRDDHSLHMQGIAQNFSADNALGCCEVKTRNTAGTTTQEECQSLTLGIVSMPWYPSRPRFYPCY